MNQHQDLFFKRSLLGESEYLTRYEDERRRREVEESKLANKREKQKRSKISREYRKYDTQFCKELKPEHTKINTSRNRMPPLLHARLQTREDHLSLDRLPLACDTAGAVSENETYQCDVISDTVNMANPPPSAPVGSRNPQTSVTIDCTANSETALVSPEETARKSRISMAINKQKDSWSRQVNMIFQTRDAANFKRRHKSNDRQSTLMDLQTCYSPRETDTINSFY